MSKEPKFPGVFVCGIVASNIIDDAAITFRGGSDLPMDVAIICPDLTSGVKSEQSIQSLKSQGLVEAYYLKALKAAIPLIVDNIQQRLEETTKELTRHVLNDSNEKAIVQQYIKVCAEAGVSHGLNTEMVSILNSSNDAPTSPLSDITLTTNDPNIKA